MSLLLRTGTGRSVSSDLLERYDCSETIWLMCSVLSRCVFVRDAHHCDRYDNIADATDVIIPTGVHPNVLIIVFVSCYH